MDRNGSISADLEFGHSGELASEEKPLSALQKSELASTKLGPKISSDELATLLTEAIGATEDVKPEEFGRTVRVYQGIYFLARGDLEGVNWLARQVNSYNRGRVGRFLQVAERADFYEKALKA